MHIMVVEDSQELNEGVVGQLSSWNRASQVHSARTVAQASHILKNHPIDVLICDLNLPDGDGSTVIAALKQTRPSAISIVLSNLLNAEAVVDALAVGAIGYIHKYDTSLGLISSIELALSGSSPISPNIAFVIARHFQESELKVSQTPYKASETGLTQREIEVLKVIEKGLSNDEAADVLGISKNTIPVHIRNIYKKLQASSRSEAIYEARLAGVI